MLILLMSVLPNILENFECELMCQFEIGDNLRYYKVNELCSCLKNDTWIAANVPIRNWRQFKVLQSE